ncbi:response regulator [Citreicella sp. C3M06]|uniref:response regulator n=1 Tax=Citreicella sp. C3M06 TaxID=2841564 RepID=UPI001C086209|nr:response regulator [Citreicella sp. C3M06]MBU2962938.1 response regulator [Citreicella sp. C3M06]
MQIAEYGCHGEERGVPQALIVDDDDADRFRLIRMCRKAGLGFDFHEAESLSKMRAAMDTRRFDIAFLDYRLGIDSGQEALAALRAHPLQRAAIAIMVTSVDHHDVVIEAMRNGCDDYLVKEELGLDAILRAVATSFERRVIRVRRGESIARRADLEERIRRLGSGLAPEMEAVLQQLFGRVSAATLQEDAGPWRRDHHDMTEMCLNGLTALSEIEEVCRSMSEPDCAKALRIAEGAV